MKYLAVFVLSFAYAVLRYNVFGTVLIANLPCFVANKAFALTSVLALLVAAYQSYKSRAQEQRHWFAFFKLTLFVHVLLSVFLFSPEYYPKMFANGKLNLSGELFMLFGVLAVALLMFKTIVKDAPIRLEILQPLSLIAIALHQFFLGYANWPKWESWPGYMPPITLIGFLAALTALFLQIKRPHDAEK